MKTENILLLLGAFLLLRFKGGALNGIKKNDLGYGYMGNGAIIFDRNQTEKGDYKNVAHISDRGDVTLYKNHGLTPTAIKSIIKQSRSVKEYLQELGL